MPESLTDTRALRWKPELDAVDLFLRARALAPQDGDVALGLVAARNAVGQGGQAAEELSALVERAPAWTAGHEQLAQLLSTLGQKERATESLERAIVRVPRQESLWSALFRIDLKREDYAALQRDVARADAAGIAPHSLELYRAIVAAELDTAVFSDALFNVRPELSTQLGLWRIRHLLRHGAIDEALPLIDEELASERSAAAWPYASLAWRLAGDERSEWLEGDDRLVQVFDLNSGAFAHRRTRRCLAAVACRERRICRSVRPRGHPDRRPSAEPDRSADPATSHRHHQRDRRLCSTTAGAGFASPPAVAAA